MLNFSNLFAPIDSESGGTIEDNEISLEGMVKFLNEDEEEKEVIDLEDKKTEKKEKVEEDKEEESEEEEEEDNEDNEDDENDEDDELKEIEEELEEPDDEKLELETPVPRREILAKYPNIFKDFPYLEKAYYREQQFTRVFPSIDDAKEAQEKATILDAFEKDLNKGDLTRVLKAVKSVNKEAFDSIADNYLGLLKEIDSDAWGHVAGNLIKDTIIAMVNEAQESNNEALKAAAAILNQFVFGTTKFEAPKRLTSTNSKKEEDKTLEQERRQFLQQRYEIARDDIQSRVTNAIKATIENNIDPKSTMTPYIRKVAIREAQEDLDRYLEKDARFKAILDKLWKYAIKNNFDKDSQDRIRRAYISRAKTLLPTVIKKARNEALKGLGKRIKNEDDMGESSSKEKAPNKKPGRSTTPLNSGKSDREKAKQIPKHMSNLDYLMQD